MVNGRNHAYFQLLTCRIDLLLVLQWRVALHHAAYSEIFVPGRRGPDVAWRSAGSPLNATAVSIAAPQMLAISGQVMLRDQSSGCEVKVHEITFMPHCWINFWMPRTSLLKYMMSGRAAALQHDCRFSCLGTDRLDDANIHPAVTAAVLTSSDVESLTQQCDDLFVEHAPGQWSSAIENNK